MADDPSTPPADVPATPDVTVGDAGAAAEASTATVDAPVAAATGSRIAVYDFRNPVFLSEGELRRLRLLHDEFARYLSARLSMYLRMELSLKVASLTTTTYAKFAEGLGNPTHLSLVKLEPLVGVGLLELKPRLSLTIADRLLGGRGQTPAEARGLSEIEIALVEDVVDLVLTEWCGQWKSVQELKPVVIGNENNGRFLQTSSRDTMMLVLTLDATLGECNEQIQFGLPFATIEAVIKKMDARRLREAPVVVSDKKSTWQGAYNRITVPVQAEWHALEMSVRELASLRVGDVIEMPPTIFKETRVLLNGTLKFVGTVGLDADRVAVQLNQKLSSEENQHALPTGRKVT
jgi:flagellar motor switch protein FliM